MCGQSLIFPDPKWVTKIGDVPKEKICLTHKSGILANKVLLFKIIRSNRQQGFVELSIEPGDYTKYVSLTLHPEEEVTFIHPHCHKAMNDKKGWVKILVQYQNEEVVQEYFINARYGIEVTLCQEKDGKVGAHYGEKFKDLAEYFEKEWKKLSTRKWSCILWRYVLPSVFLCKKRGAIAPLGSNNFLWFKLFVFEIYLLLKSLCSSAFSCWDIIKFWWLNIKIIS